MCAEGGHRSNYLRLKEEGAYFVYLAPPPPPSRAIRACLAGALPPAPAPGVPRGYLGCYADARDDRAFSLDFKSILDNTPEVTRSRGACEKE